MQLAIFSSAFINKCDPKIEWGASQSVQSPKTSVADPRAVTVGAESLTRHPNEMQMHAACAHIQLASSLEALKGLQDMLSLVMA